MHSSKKFDTLSQGCSIFQPCGPDECHGTGKSMGWIGNKQDINKYDF